MKRATLISRATPVACGLIAVWATLVARAATAQSFVEEAPEDACAAVDTLDSADTSRTAEHLRRTCRLQQLDARLAADRRDQIVAETEARDARVAAWVNTTQPSRVVHPIAVAGYLGTGVSNYGLVFAWNVLRRLELEARIGWRNMTCSTQFSPDGADCTRRTIAAGARWYLMDTNFSPFLSGGFAITGSHLQILQANSDGTGNTLLIGDGRAHSVSGGGDWSSTSATRASASNTSTSTSITRGPTDKTWTCHLARICNPFGRTASTKIVMGFESWRAMRSELRLAMLTILAASGALAGPARAAEPGGAVHASAASPAARSAPTPAADREDDTPPGGKDPQSKRTRAATTRPRKSEGCVDFRSPAVLTSKTRIGRDGRSPVEAVSASPASGPGRMRVDQSPQSAGGVPCPSRATDRALP